MVFFTYGIKNPKACRGAPEVLGDEGTDQENFRKVR
jgi:hypothetical protein